MLIHIELTDLNEKISKKMVKSLKFLTQQRFFIMFILYGSTYNLFEVQSFRVLKNRFTLNKNYLDILTSLPLPELLVGPKKK
jgi:hypothetical protein